MARAVLECMSWELDLSVGAFRHDNYQSRGLSGRSMRSGGEGCSVHLLGGGLSVGALRHDNYQSRGLSGRSVRWGGEGCLSALSWELDLSVGPLRYDNYQSRGLSEKCEIEVARAVLSTLSCGPPSQFASLRHDNYQSRGLFCATCEHGWRRSVRGARVGLFWVGFFYWRNDFHAIPPRVFFSAKQNRLLSNL